MQTGRVSVSLLTVQSPNEARGVRKCQQTVDFFSPVLSVLSNLKWDDRKMHPRTSESLPQALILCRAVCLLLHFKFKNLNDGQATAT
jgi:hypothetical protein